MSSLKRLISHQRIRIDAHEAGTGRSVNAGAVHIDKRFTEKRLKGKWVKIPIFGDPISSNLEPDDFKSVLSEIRQVLKKDQRVLATFADAVAEAQLRWSSGNITLGRAREAAESIADRLGLRPQIIEEIARKVGEKYTELLTVHSDNQGDRYWLHFTSSFFEAGPGAGRIYKGWDSDLSKQPKNKDGIPHD